ncbi:hypothetical protein [Caulobacter sp. Root655]|uniref:hypothetical protein n=1 Tax=Caulobacter sp. Root655 TaxID=1736578 RepID=UPI000A7C770F|nr:hypothetical protein [Caulobacter sp. Root655]
MHNLLVRTYCCVHAVLGINALFDCPFHHVIAASLYFTLAVAAHKIYAKPKAPAPPSDDAK